MTFKFKSIMCGGTFVDTNKLHKGIYSAFKPILFDEDYTKEKFLQNYDQFAEIMGLSSDDLKEIKKNFESCTFVDIDLTVKL